MFYTLIKRVFGQSERAQGLIDIIKWSSDRLYERLVYHYLYFNMGDVYSNWLSSELKFIKQFLLYEKAFYYLFTLEVSTCFFVAFASTSSLLRTSLLLLHMWYAFITGPYTPYVGLTPYSQPTKSKKSNSISPCNGLVNRQTNWPQLARSNKHSTQTNQQ